MNGQLLGAVLLPHPPIMVRGVGGNQACRVERTVRAIDEAGARIGDLDPEVIVLISPHGPVSRGGPVITAPPVMNGDLSAFGSGRDRVTFRGDAVLGRALVNSLSEAGMESTMVDDKISGGMDHGAVVPLTYVARHTNPSLVLVSGLGHDPQTARDVGQLLARAVEETGRRGVLIISGDLSHRLKPDAPAGFAPEGAQFDQNLLDLLVRGQGEAIRNLCPTLVDRAGECGYIPVCLLSGALGDRWRGRVLSYEGPFGVGYAVAQLYPEQGMSSLYTDLARASLFHYLKHQEQYPVTMPLPRELSRPAGAFVSLKKDGDLRGCMGTVRPQTPDLARDIVSSAVSAGVHDPRFDPVTVGEMGDLEITVDVMGPLEQVSGAGELDPGRFGVVVEKGRRGGILLPRIHGIDDASSQLSIALRKAGIGPSEAGVDLYRFQVERYGGGEEDQ